jgi:hypothetical protein
MVVAKIMPNIFWLKKIFPNTAVSKVKIIKHAEKIKILNNLFFIIKFLCYWKPKKWKTTPKGLARGTCIVSDSKSLRKFVPDFIAAVGAIPPTGIACPFSDSPP